MIIDHIDHLMEYESLLPNLKKGLDAIHAMPNLELGRYEFDGGYFMVQQGQTKPIAEGTYEAHRNYIDVQIILEGSEEVAWEDVRALQTVIPYSPEKDAERFSGEHEHVMKISKGMFYAAFPRDAHQPVAHTAEPQTFSKIVLKLPVEQK
ncbi:MAG: YhcH/YjgK/YiaL family protein [Lachnospiraceae bacterium]|nr:YhcH/YjgK/YiaL family protein [Lachnospiraceae bacterium]